MPELLNVYFENYIYTHYHRLIIVDTLCNICHLIDHAIHSRREIYTTKRKNCHESVDTSYIRAISFSS